MSAGRHKCGESQWPFVTGLATLQPCTRSEQRAIYRFHLHVRLVGTPPPKAPPIAPAVDAGEQLAQVRRRRGRGAAPAEHLQQVVVAQEEEPGAAQKGGWRWPGG